MTDYKSSTRAVDRVSKQIIEQIGQDYDFKFLRLPLEIKLLICRYLSVTDILSLSEVNEDCKKFADEYFIYHEVRLPDNFMVCREAEDRYVLSINVDFANENFSFVMRERSVEAAKLLNFAELKDAVLRSDIYDFADRRMLDLYHSEAKRSQSFRRICPWFAEISNFVLENAYCIQTLDFTLFKCHDSLTAMEALAKNSFYLKHLTLRNPKEYRVFPALAMGSEGQEFLSLSNMIAEILEKSSLTSLHLIDFHSESLCRVWWTPDSNFPRHRGHFLRVNSETLQTLELTSSCYSQSPDYIGEVELICPKLTRLVFFSEQNAKPCLYHLRQVAPGITDGLARHSPDSLRINGSLVKNKWFTDICNQWSCPYRM